MYDNFITKIQNQMLCIITDTQALNKNVKKIHLIQKWMHEEPKSFFNFVDL